MNPDGPDVREPTGADADSTTPEAAPADRSVRKGTRRVKTSKEVHQVTFVSYPKLLFIWPVILAGLVFAPFSSSPRPASADVFAYEAALAAAASEAEAAEAQSEAEEAEAQSEAVPTTNQAVAPVKRAEPANPFVSGRLETLGWIYILIMLIVALTLGVDVDRNQFIFWVVLILAIWIGGRYLAEVKGFTLFGDIYRWFAGLDVQYSGTFGLSLSLILLVPYLIMLGWAHINDKWRITHNEFEHYSLGKMDDSLGRGAKTIRTSFPDVLELLTGLAGTLVVYNATGTRELRSIPHVMFLPLIRKRLNKILEKTAITAAQMEEEEDDDEDA